MISAPLLEDVHLNLQMAKQSRQPPTFNLIIKHMHKKIKPQTNRTHSHRYFMPLSLQVQNPGDAGPTEEG